MNPSGKSTSGSATQPWSWSTRVVELRYYGLAVFSVAVAVGAALLFDSFHFRDAAVPLLLFAVAISSWYGRTGPAVLAVVLSTISFYWYFVEPVRTIYIYPSEIPYFIIFVAFALLISWFARIRRRADKALREQANLLNLTHDTIFVMDMDGVIRYWNRGAEERYGWTAEQAVGRFVHPLLETVFPAPPEQIKAELTRTGRWEGELRHTRKNGTQLVVSSRWSLERGNRGEPVAILETNNDITERKHAEEALRRLNRELRAISDCNQTLLRATDEQSLLNEICRIACEEAGYRMAFVTFAEHDEAKTVRPVAWTGAEAEYLATAGFTWADTERGRGQTGTAIRSGKTCCIQDFATDPRLAPWREGLLERGFRSGIAVPLKDEEGHAFGSLTIHSAQPNAFTPEEIRLLEELAGDMAFGIVNLRSQAARKQAEETIRRQGAELRQVLDFIPDLVAEFDTDRKRLYANRPTLDYFGVTLEEWWNIPDPYRFYHPDDRERIESIYTQSESAFPREYEARMRRADGEYRWFFVRENPLRDEGGCITRWYVSGTDIEDIKRAEEERIARVCFLERMDRINRAMQGTNDLEQMMSDAVDAMLSIFDSDRAFLYYPCDPDAPSYEVVMERIRLGFPQARGVIPMTPDTARGFQIVRTSSGVVTFGPGCDHPLIGDFTKRSGHKSSIGIALYPKTGKPWVLAMHQCSYPRVWTPDERKLLEEIARRLEDSLTSLLMFRSLRESEKALRQSEAYLAEAERINHSGTWAWNPASGIQYWSTECYRIMGFDPAEGVPHLQQFLEAVHPEDRSQLRERLQKVAGEKTSYETEYRIIRPSGEVRDLRVIGHPVFDSAGNLLEYVGTSIDITERKRAEETLRRTAAYLADAQRLTHTGVWAGDRNSKPLYWSEEVFRIFGFDPQLGLPTPEQALERIYPEDFDKFQRGTINEKGYLESEYRIVLPDGTLKYVFGSAHPVLDRKGEIVEVVGVVIDITERKRAEEALRRAEGYLIEAQRLTHTGAWATDAVPEPLYWSEELFRLYGLDSQQGFPTHEQAVQRVHPEDRDKYVQAFHTVIHQKVDSDVEFRTVLPDGTIRYLYGLGHPILNTNGDVVEVVGTTVDITERKRAEEERARLRQLESDLAHINRVSIMGELAASISHELNQPIAASIMNASLALQWLERDPPDLAQARQRTAQIIEMGELASEIIDRLRSLYKKEPPKREPLTINELIGEMVGLLRPQATRHAVSVRADLADSLPIVLGDSVQIQQVLMNLMLNGIEAMSDTGGVLTVKSQPAENGQIKISVHDTGPGLPPGKAGQIFDAFFTTKPQGSGMGLAISKSIVESHGGRIWANDNGGRGATFQFSLPVAPAETSLPEEVSDWSFAENCAGQDNS